MSVDFSAIIENFLTAELGEEVRGSLVAIAEALEDAINSQLLMVTSDLTDPDANTAAQAAVVGAAVAAALSQGGMISETVTALTDYRDNGWWFVPPAYIKAPLTQDLPADIANETALLIGLKLDNYHFWQMLFQKNAKKCWMRSVNTEQQPVSLGGWVSQRPDEAFWQHGQIPAETTSLVDFTDNGWWTVPAAYIKDALLLDLPADVEIETCWLGAFTMNSGIVWQELKQKNSSKSWLRTVTISGGTKTAGAWIAMARGKEVGELLYSKRLRTVTGVNADNISDNCYYLYGSNDTAVNTPGTGRVGAIMPIWNDENTGYQLGFNYTQTAMYLRFKKLGSFLNWRKIAYSDEIPTGSMQPVVTYLSETIPSSGITEGLAIYIPVGTHYIEYNMRHYEKTADNCDVWRIFKAYQTDSGFLREKTITESGEWECAIRITGREDFAGGSTHGDEIMTGDFLVFLDGALVEDLTTLVSSSFKELRIVRQSLLYDPGDPAVEPYPPEEKVAFAEHGCEYVFTAEGLRINQSVKWLAEESILRSYLAMFPISKSAVNHAYSDLDFSPIDLQNAVVPFVKSGAKKAVLYGADVNAEFRTERYPTGLVGGDVWSVSDNSGQNYYKNYYHVLGSDTPNAAVAHVGDLWQSTTVYKINA